MFWFFGSSKNTNNTNLLFEEKSATNNFAESQYFSPQKSRMRLKDRVCERAIWEMKYKIVDVGISYVLLYARTNWCMCDSAIQCKSTVVYYIN